MSSRVLIDTSTLLDAAMSERPDWQFAVMLLDEIAYGRLEGMVAATSLRDAYFVLSKCADEASARGFVQAVIEASAVIAVDGPLCRTAALGNEPDLEDGIIRACAEREGASFITSRDEEAFLRSPIKRLSAWEYASLFCDYDEIEV